MIKAFVVLLIASLIFIAKGLPLIGDFPKILEPFPPLRRIIETFLVTTDSQVEVKFQDAFCNGRNFTVIDNNVHIATVIGLTPRFCGINTSSYIPIVEPQFTNFDYTMILGFHNLTLIVEDSPIGSASIRVTFFPEAGVKLNILSVTRREELYI